MFNLIIYSVIDMEYV